MARRADSYPDKRSRAILAGRNPAETPNSRLAALIRSFNARLARLPAETVRELQPDWVASFGELERQLDAVREDQERRFDHIEQWALHWDQRLAKPGWSYQGRIKEKKT